VLTANIGTTILVYNILICCIRAVEVVLVYQKNGPFSFCGSGSPFVARRLASLFLTELGQNVARGLKEGGGGGCHSLLPLREQQKFKISN